MTMISSSSQMRASNAARPSSAEVPPEGERVFLNSELWHACAGPLVSLPAVGSRVVYFPQGHSEQVAASTQKEVDAQMPAYPNLPPQIICQLHDVVLHADVETDEVYCQMTLQPLLSSDKESIFTTDIGSPSRQPTIFFCKTLTASDTSTHGGFSIPRRAAEKVFPPLDFTIQPPAQQLIARDLHDTEWKFRHIYRGQPKRHLLTTGWSVFVSAKRLVAGDSVLFIRNDKGQLLLGIRRAARPQTVMPSSVLSSDTMHIGVLAAAAHAANTGSRFTVFYNPRASPSEFVIALSKFEKAVHHSRVSVGMRFRMLFETEESSVRRYMGTITGVSDLDPVRWPSSHWRSIKVGWDESTVGERQRRVSLWEIEPLTTFLVYPPAANWRLQHPLDMEFESFKRPSAWLQFHNGSIGSTDLVAQGMGMNSWLSSFQPKTDITMESDAYNVLGATGTYPSQQIHFQQHSQLMLPDIKPQIQTQILSQQPHVSLQQQSQNLSGPVHQQQVSPLPNQQPILQSTRLLQQAHHQQLVQHPRQQQPCYLPIEKQANQQSAQHTSLQQLSMPQKGPQLLQHTYQQVLQEVPQQSLQYQPQLANLQRSHPPIQDSLQQPNDQMCQQPHLLKCQQPSQHHLVSKQHKHPRLEQQLPSQQLQTLPSQQQLPSQQLQCTQPQKQPNLHQSLPQSLPQPLNTLASHHNHFQDGLTQSSSQLVHPSSLQQQALSTLPQAHCDHLQVAKKEVHESTEEVLSQTLPSTHSQSIFPSEFPPLAVLRPRNSTFPVQQIEQPLFASQLLQQELSHLQGLQQSQTQLSYPEQLRHRQSTSFGNVQGAVVDSRSQSQVLPKNSVSTPQSASTDSSSGLSSTGGSNTLQSIVGNFAADALSSQTGPIPSSQSSMEPVSMVSGSEVHPDLSAPSSWASAAASQLSSVIPAGTKDLESTCVSSDAENALPPSYSISVPPIFSNAFRENFSEHHDAHLDLQGQTLLACSADIVDSSLIEPAESRSYGCNSEFQVQYANHLNHISISDADLPFGSTMLSESLEEPYFLKPLPPARTYTKVHKSGCVGRSLDVSRFSNYDELRCELAKLFGLEGQLECPSSGWQLIFVDKENDWLLLGDDPWEEFVNNVRSITILSPSEVVRMQDGIGLPSVPKQMNSSSENCHTQLESCNPSSNITSTCSFEY